jgi:hypothetical protein
MSYIKDDSMTLRNRPLVERPGANHIEECIAAPTGVEQPLNESVMNIMSTIVTDIVATVVLRCDVRYCSLRYDSLFCSEHD